MNAYTVGLLSGHVSIAGGEFYKTGDFPGWKSVKNVSWFDPKHDQPQLHAAVSLPTSSTIHHFFENCGMVPFYQYNVCLFYFMFLRCKFAYHQYPTTPTFLLRSKTRGNTMRPNSLHQRN